MAGQTYTFNIKALFDASDVKAKVGDIQNTLSQLKLPDKMAVDFNKAFANANKALDDFISKSSKGIKTKGDANGITKSFENVTKELNNLDNLMIKLQGQIGNGLDLSKIIKFDDSTRTKLESISQAVDNLQTQINTINTGKLSELEQALNAIATAKAKEQGAQAIELFKQGDIEGAISLLDSVISKLEAVKKANEAQGHNTANIEASITALASMQSTIQNAQQATADLVNEQNLKIAEGAKIAAEAEQDLARSLQAAGEAAHGLAEGANGAGGAIGDAADKAEDFVHQVSQVKSRIQYFFGLANSINLVKRAIRDAFNTIKELDKAMTETAVVTDFSVSDMWSQLPEYTKRANELGVTTLAAYQAATLYYQQGLKTNEVNALSVETLQMARIAGLDAAEATDRMTNALRGFNMEITATNAQRVDDVYSELAANTASNVDEISTAMTKVASLANNANMEFETTAAFLAQIIETTRESAETAGTALKTVVARFSEVKKLIDEGQVKGQDSEGEIIDVNKVQAALRTANIDMSKYFLGEVGLDDIFMELASKWDSLTTLQQRYIATQAAGSRQQSRFIAMMSDYARTQELVGKAYNSTGAAERQFEKTQESLESKLNRLKNAWNEFTMGLTNNVIVKTAVDFLTMLLNIVNKLTGAFGDTAGSILKFVTAAMAFKGLGNLFKSGGLFETGLLKIFNGTSLGNWMKKGLENAAKEGGATVNIGESLFGGIKKAGESLLSSFVKIGKGSANLLGIPGAAALGDTAAALTGIATAFTAIAVAAGIAMAVYQGWLKNTDKGHIKIAEKYAESMHKVADSLQQQANRAKEAKQRVEEYNNSISTAETPQKRNEAILAQNEYITSLLKEDATYAQYIQQVTSRDGQIYLTLDSEALASAVDKIAESALRASALSDIADAATAYTRAKYYENQLQNVNLNNGTQTRLQSGGESASDLRKLKWWQLLGRGPGDYSEANAQTASTTTYTRSTTGETEVSELTEHQLALYASLQAQATAERIQASTYLTSAGTKLTNLYAPNANLDASQASLVANAFANTFQLDEAFDQLIDEYAAFFQGLSEDFLVAKYTDMFGVAPETNKKPELARAIAQQEAYDAQAGQTTQNLVGLVKDEAGKIIVEALTGSFDGITENLGSQLWSAFEKLNIDQRQMVQQLLGVDNVAGARSELIALGRELSNAIDTNFIGQLSKTTSFSTKQLETISKKLTGAQKKSLAQVAKNFSTYGRKISDTIVTAATNNMLAQTPDQAKSDFIDKLSNLSNNPVLLLQAINDAAADASEEVQKLATDLQEKLADNPAFSSSHQLQFFLTSDEFEKINEQLEKFIEENATITPEYLNELAASSETLSALIDNNVVSIEGLTNILNSLSSGRIGIFDLSDSLIDLYNDFYDVEGAATRAYATINNFKFGGDGTEFHQYIQSLIDKLKELQKTGQYVAMSKYLAEFFDDVPQGVKEIDRAIKLLDRLQKNNGGDFWTELFGLKYTTKNGQKSFDFQKIIDQFLASGNTNFKDYIKKKFKDKYGFSLKDSMIDILIGDLGTHGDVKTDIANAQITNTIKKYVDGLGKGVKVDKNVIKEKIAQIAKAYNLDPAKLLEEFLNNNGKKSGTGKGTKWTYKGVTFTKDDLDMSDIDSTVTSLETAINSALKDKDIRAKLEKLGFDLSDPESIKKIDMSSLLQALGTDKDGNFDLGTAYAKISDLVPEIGDGTLTPQQWIEQQLNGQPIKLNATLNYVGQDEDGNFTTKTLEVPITAGDTSKLESIIAELGSAAPNMVELLGLEDAQKLLAEIEGGLVKFDTDTHTINVAYTSATQAETVVNNLKSALDKINTTTYTAKVNVDATKHEIKINGKNGEQITFTITTAARGGFVKSFASGTNSIQPGLALTGEEAPEIIWNAEKGYAYLAGKNGPEINNLMPGDRVFNGQQTKDILRRSGISSFSKGSKIPSYAWTSWGKTPTGPGTGTREDKKGKKRDWKNELDWLYNLVQDIAEHMRKVDIFTLKYQKYLHGTGKKTSTLYSYIKKQLDQLAQAQKGYETERKKRKTELEKLSGAAADEGYGKYVRYNKKDNTVEIDWDKINALAKSGSDKDKKKYDKIVEYINKIEAAKQKYDDAEKAILDIDEQIYEIKKQMRDSYINLENRVLEAVEANRQAQIDKLSKLNESIDNVNSNILNSIQKEIELQRQIRDNTKTEKEITDMETRLAFLRRDTTGSNQAEILQLERQLQEARESYSDTLLDQSLNKLSEVNENAKEQRDQQINLLQEQLDYDKENGKLWSQVTDYIIGAFTAGGNIRSTSDLIKLLKETELYNSLSPTQQKQWLEELIQQLKEAGVYLLDEEILGKNNKTATAQSNNVTSAGQSSGTADTIETSSNTAQSKSTSIVSNSLPEEYFSNNNNFISLPNIESAVVNGNQVNNAYTDNSTFNIEINVGSLNNDYDVDQLINRIKEELYDSAAYRNVTSLSFIR